MTVFASPITSFLPAKKCRLRFAGGKLLLALALALVIGTVTSVSESRAQFEPTWMTAGSFQNFYRESGAVSVSGRTGWEYPAQLYLSHHRNTEAWYVGLKNWTDAQGAQHDFYVNRVGQIIPGEGNTYPQEHYQVSRWGNNDNPTDSQPGVYVDGALTFNHVSFVDRVDPDLKAARMLYTRTNTRVGVTMERKVYAFSQEFHDQYHIIEYVYTNTGNVDDDEEVELPDQTLNDVYIYRFNRHQGNIQSAWVTEGGQTWGKYNMIDVVGDGHQDYNVDFRAVYTWAGWVPNFAKPYSNLGSPLVEDDDWWVEEGDTTGRLAGGTATGQAFLFGEKKGNERSYDIEEDFPPSRSMDADNLESRDPREHQPHIMGWQDSDDTMVHTGGTMRDYYEKGILGTGDVRGTYPHHADIIEPDGNFTTLTGDPSRGRQGGHGAMHAFGPYTLEPGESVRIVEVRAAAGLDLEAKIGIGEAFKRGGFDDSLHIQYDANGDGTIQGTEQDGERRHAYDESLTKNAWVLTEIDSLYEVFGRARQNYWSGFDIPLAPKPPKRVDIAGRPDRIEITWETYSDPGDVENWEIYRTNQRVSNGPYEKVATLPADRRSFEDTEGLQRGINYFYYVQAVGSELSEPGPAGTPAGVRLRSGRFQAQSWAPVTLKRPPGETISEFEVVPNPFNIGSETSIRWPGGQEFRLAFLDIPGQCRIQIYTETGELVTTIDHTDGSGDEFWNLTTDARQIVSSGIYVAIVTDLETGEQQSRKFSIIR